ncbi:MAG: D-glycero-alpha-D-manno-heptose-1,7-bisphosphate 7-phosphatase [Gemmatimonadaceae bacterium]
MPRPALFCDRDGTIIRDAHYLRDPALVELLPGASAMLRNFAEAGYALVVVTNQSGIARGLLSEADYQAVRARLDAELATDGVRLDASMHCPHEPSISGPCRCRKPGTLLHEQAAAALDLDLTRSVYLGDRWRDVAPALALGGRGILVPGPDTPADDVMRARAEAEVAPTLADVTRLVLG